MWSLLLEIANVSIFKNIISFKCIRCYYLTFHNGLKKGNNLRVKGIKNPIQITFILPLQAIHT